MNKVLQYTFLLKVQCISGQCCLQLHFSRSTKFFIFQFCLEASCPISLGRWQSGFYIWGVHYSVYHCPVTSVFCHITVCIVFYLLKLFVFMIQFFCLEDDNEYNEYRTVVCSEIWLTAPLNVTDDNDDDNNATELKLFFHCKKSS